MNRTPNDLVKVLSITALPSPRTGPQRERAVVAVNPLHPSGLSGDELAGQLSLSLRRRGVAERVVSRRVPATPGEEAWEFELERKGPPAQGEQAVAEWVAATNLGGEIDCSPGIRASERMIDALAKNPYAGAIAAWIAVMQRGLVLAIDRELENPTLVLAAPATDAGSGTPTSPHAFIYELRRRRDLAMAKLSRVEHWTGAPGCAW